MENELNKRIAQEQAKIEVPSYQDVAWDGAWKKRTAAMFGIGAVGLAAGAAIGLIAPVFPLLIGAPVAVGLVQSVAMFSALGVTAGMGAGIVVGPAAGAAAATAKERERRDLARMVEQAIKENPNADVKLIEKQVQRTDESSYKSPRSFTEKVKDFFSKYVNIKSGLPFIALGMATGGLFAAALVASGGAGIAAFAMPMMDVVLGKAATTAAITAYSVGLGAGFGSLFALNFPKVTRMAVNIAGEFLSGRAVGAAWPEHANLPEQKPILTQAIETKEPEQQNNFRAKLANKEFQNFSERVKAAPAGELGI